MVSDTPPDFDVTSSEEFDAALETLLETALHNDVDPRGAWEYRTTTDGTTDWEVLIIELEPDDEDE